jgi:hypothetical protein
MSSTPTPSRANVTAQPATARGGLPLLTVLSLLLAAGGLIAQDPQKSADQAALERALAELDQPPDPVTATAAQQPIGFNPAAPGNFRLFDLSFVLLFAGGGSTEPDEVLGELFAGGHDPRKRGVTLQNAELTLQGAVDPYFRTDLHLITFLDPIEGETVVELEEAFLTTTSLPDGFEIEAGQFFTEFGRINPRHNHEWDFLDTSIVNARFFGADGLRGPGMRAGWLTPLPWFSELHVGFQNASGETTASFLANDEFFEERPIGGRPFQERGTRGLGDLIWLARWVNGFDLDPMTNVQIGMSGLFGPNAAGRDTTTTIVGADLVVRWNDGVGGRQAREILWQTELMYRSYETDGFVDEGDPNDPADDVVVDAATLRDHGLYSQLVVRLSSQWRAGLRYDFAGCNGMSYDPMARLLGSRNDDPFRSDRHRITPMLEWSPTHFSRVRLQYSFDHSKSLDDETAHSLWLGMQVGIGSHAAHAF